MQSQAAPSDETSNESHLSALASIGLSQYESKCYLASLRSGPSAINQIGIVAGVPRSKVYGAVRNLVRRGLLEQGEDDPKIYVAKSPKEVLIPLMENEMRRIKVGLESLNELEVVHESMEYVNRTDALKSKVTRYSPRNRVDRRMRELFEASKSKVVILTTSAGLVRISRMANTLYERSKLGMRLELFSPTMDGPVFSTAVQSLREVENSSVSFTPPMLPVQVVIVDSHSLLICELKPDDAMDDGVDVGFLIENGELAEIVEDFVKVTAPMQRQIVSTS